MLRIHHPLRSYVPFDDPGVRQVMKLTKPSLVQIQLTQTKKPVKYWQALVLLRQTLNEENERHYLSANQSFWGLITLHPVNIQVGQDTPGHEKVQFHGTRMDTL